MWTLVLVSQHLRNPLGRTASRAQMRRCAVQGRGAEVCTPSWRDDGNAAAPLLNWIGTVYLDEKGEVDLPISVARN